MDSLERAVDVWTPAKIELATDEQLNGLISDWEELMLGYSAYSGPRSEYYARRILSLEPTKGCEGKEFSAYKMLGQIHWAHDRYDSAAFYYNKAMTVIERMEGTQKDEDNLLSSLYGTIGNLYSMQDSIETAMAYYHKAGELFEKNGWVNSLAVLYYNMGETWRGAGELKEAEKCFEQTLEYSAEAKDSLYYAQGLKGLAYICLSEGKLAKAAQYLNDADVYFEPNEEVESLARIEILEIMNLVAARQKKNLFLILILTVLAVLLVVGLSIAWNHLKKVRKQNLEATEFIEESLEQVPAAGKIKLNDREVEILKLMADGKDYTEIAGNLHLSPETIKWYKKRLFIKFDVASSTALISAAYKNGLL